MTDKELLATCTHLTVECWPRYWEDATINGEADTEGKVIPLSTYVPDDFLCHGDRGYGDYIIMDVSGDGQIAKYERPTPDRSEWVRLS